MAEVHNGILLDCTDVPAPVLELLSQRAILACSTRGLVEFLSFAQVGVYCCLFNCLVRHFITAGSLLGRTTHLYFTGFVFAWATFVGRATRAVKWGSVQSDLVLRGVSTTVASGAAEGSAAAGAPRRRDVGILAALSTSV